jgi:hypothetical protein
MVAIFIIDRHKIEENRCKRPPTFERFHPLVNCAYESQRRLYHNVNIMTALNYKTWMVQTLKLN